MYFPALRHRNFAVLLLGVLISNVGTSMQLTAQNWLVYKMTGDDPVFLGWLGLCSAISAIIGTPLGGVLADRVDRLRLIYAMQVVGAVLATTLTILVWSGVADPHQILAIHLLTSLAFSIDSGVRQVLMPELVPREALQSAMSLGPLSFMLPVLVGPAIAGLMIDPIGPGGVFLINAVSYAAVVVALRALRGVPPQAPASVPAHIALLDGIRYGLKEPWVRGLLVATFLAAFFARSYPQMVPVFANAFGAGPRGYGWIMACVGAGSLVGSLVVGSLREVPWKGRAMIVGGLVQCTAVALFARCGGLAQAMSFLFFAGIAVAVFNAMIGTMIQLYVPATLRGRITAFYYALFTGIPLLGSFGLVILAKALREGSQVTVAAPLRAGLAWAEIGANLGESNGVARAIWVGAIVVGIALLVVAPRYWRERTMMGRAA